MNSILVNVRSVRRSSRGIFGLLCCLAVLAATPLAAEPVGEAEFVRGDVRALRDDAGAGRALASGDAIHNQEIVESHAKSFAVLAFSRGGKVSVRPLTRVRIVDQSVVDAEQGRDLSLVLEKGGLHGRVEGLQGASARIRTPVATLAISDAEFTARWCEGDCAAEVDVEQGKAVAKALVLRGFVEAGPAGGRARKLVAGDAVHEQDILRTGENSYVMLLFRDGGRATLDERTVLEISEYLYQPADLRESRAKMQLKRGKARFQTGAIGKTNPDYYQVLTPTFVAGVRGTGFDIACIGDCIEDGEASADGNSDGTFLAVWEGSVIQRNEAGSFEVGAGQSSFVASRSSSPVRISALPEAVRSQAPRPDEFGIDPDYLFRTTVESSAPPGLYVQVQSGNVAMETDSGKVLQVEPGRTGYIDPAGVQLIKTSASMGFMQQQGSCP